MQRSTGHGAYLPVGLTLVDQGHDAEDLDLLDLTNVANLLTDLADIERIVVALGLRLRVEGGGVLPGLRDGRSGRGKRVSDARRTWGNMP